MWPYLYQLIYLLLVWKKKLSLGLSKSSLWKYTICRNEQGRKSWHAVSQHPHFPLGCLQHIEEAVCTWWCEHVWCHARPNKVRCFHLQTKQESGQVLRLENVQAMLSGKINIYCSAQSTKEYSLHTMPVLSWMIQESRSCFESWLAWHIFNCQLGYAVPL